MTGIIFGVDILPGSSPFSKNPRYALVVLEGEAVLDRFPDATFYQLSRLIHQRRPTIVALDNVFELAPDLDALRRFVSSLPPQTLLVQVTGSPQKSRSLQEVAAEYGLASPRRFDALEEALASARLAGLNAGVEVKVLEDETRVLVTRNVSLGPGGSSQGRYRRSVHTSILRVTNSIRKALSGSNLDFDLFKEKSDFGLDKSEFVVYAPRIKLSGIVKPFRGGSIRVIIQPVYKDKIEFASRRTSPDTVMRGPKIDEKKLIVGLDPGITCGLAVLSLKGDVLHLRSQKGLTRGDLTRIVAGLGVPIIVAADVRPEPEFVKKFASSLDAFLFIPEYSLQVLEKQELAQEFSAKSRVDVKNAHERDALAAAAKAFRHYKNKFEQIEAYASDNHLSLPLDEVKALVVRGRPLTDAFEAVSKRIQDIPKPLTVEETVAKPSLSPEETQPLINQLRSKTSDQGRQIENLREEIELLQRKLRDSEAIREAAEKELARKKSIEELEIKKEREYSALRREIENLRRQLQSKDIEIQAYIGRLEILRRLNLQNAREEMVLLKPIDSFTTNGIEVASKLYNIKEGDNVILIDASGGGASTADNLAKVGVNLVVSSTPMSHQAEETFQRYNIPVVKSDQLKLSWVEGLPYAEVSRLKKALKESLEKKKEEEAISDLSKLIGEYKRERQTSDSA